MIQSNVERFACNFCDYETLEDQSIKRHLLRNHRENKVTIINPMKCCMCEFKSQRIRNLKRHIQTVYQARKYNTITNRFQF